MKKFMKIIDIKTKLKCAGVILMALASSLLASLWPVYLGNIYTDISSGEISTLAQGTMTIISFGIIYLLAECISIARRVLLDCIIATYEAKVRSNSIRKMLKMPVSYCHGKLSGERTAQLNQGIAGFSQLLKICCNDIIATVFVAGCTLVQVALNAPGVMAVMMLAYILFTTLISVLQIRSQNGVRERILSYKNRLDGNVCQSISNLELIRSMNAEDFETRRLQPNIDEIKRTEKRHHRYMGSFDCLKQACKVGFQAAILILSIALIAMGKMEAGAVITVCLLFQQLIKPIDEVYRFMDETAASIIKSRTLIEVVTAEEDPVFLIDSQTEENEEQEIVLNNITIIDPENSKEIVHFENMMIPTNKITGIVGESGSGKSSLFKGLNRYYPHAGDGITVFGNDLAKYSQKELIEKICYIPQTSLFFAGTVRENLMYGLDREISDYELQEALDKACLVDTLRKKIKQPVIGQTAARNILDLNVVEGGNNFSGGERQRMTIARAFLRTPKLYIFDESTANLDEKVAEKILDNVEAHAKSIQAGVVYISHDQNVIDRCQETIRIQKPIKAETAA